MGLDSMKDLYLDQIGDLYSAETQIIDAIGKRLGARAIGIALT